MFFSFEPLKLSALPLDLAVLLLDLLLLLGRPILLALELIPDQATAQSAHSSADRRASTWRADCRTNDRTAGCPQATAYQGAFFPCTERLRTSA